MGLMTNISVDNDIPKPISLNETQNGVSTEVITYGVNQSLYPFTFYLVNESLPDEYEGPGGSAYMVNQQAPEALVSLVMCLHLHVIPIFSVLGIVGNTFCIAVFLYERLRGLSFTVYMVSILLAEAVYLLTLFHEWLTDFRQLVDSYRMGGWCQFITMVHNSSSFVAQWSILALVLDRYISACRPKWEPHYCSPVKARIICLSIVIVAVILYLNLSMIHGEYDMGTKHYCLPLPQYKFTYQALTLVQAFVNSLLLYIIVTSLTCITIAQCLRQRARSRHPVRLTARSASAMIKHSVQDSGGNESQSQRVIFGVFMVTYLIFTLPAQAVYIYTAIYNLQHQMSGDLSLRNHYLGRVFMFMQHAGVLFNFPLFIIAYRGFRFQLKLMLKQLGTCVYRCYGSKMDKDTKLSLAENGHQRHYLAVIHRDCESEN